MPLHTTLCDRLGIDVPIIQAGASIYTSADLASAVSNAGGLGSLGVWQRSTTDLEASLRMLRDSTDRPFALNHVVPDLDEDAFEITLKAHPAVVAFALDDAGALVDRVHAAGSLAMQQICTVEQAERAAANGIDLIVAQGSEAGGYAGDSVSTLALVPQVVDAVDPIPVIAAGGIADGRGVAAALALGAAGVNLGTRFLATKESPVSSTFRRQIAESVSEQWRQFDFPNTIRPNPGARGYGTKLRLRSNDFTRTCEERLRAGTLEVAEVQAQLMDAIAEGRLDEIFVSAGHSAGMISEVPSVADVITSIVADVGTASRRLHSVVQP
jgi:nitronate monooxygenase/enoyl-[acyl-carrier protein] reductase II